MAKTSPEANREILEAALHGLELQREKLDEQIAQVRSMLGRRVGRPPKPSAASSEHRAASSSRPRRQLSEEARKRIAAAQKKRWAAFRKSTGKKA
jgi:hypothetical protein